MQMDVLVGAMLDERARNVLAGLEDQVSQALVERPRQMCRHAVVAPPVPAMETNARAELPVEKPTEKLAVISAVRPRACLGRMEPALGTVAAPPPAALAYPPTGVVAYLAHPAKHQL